MVRLLAKIRPHDFGVADNIFRLSVGDFLTAHQHDEALREAHDRTHDVLDQDDRNSALVELFQKREDILDFGMGQAGHRFVGNQQLWLCRDCAGQFELAHLNLRQVARHLAGLSVKTNQSQQFNAAGIDAIRMERTGSFVHRIEHRHTDIVGKIEADKRPWQLEAACEAAVRALMRRETIHRVAVEMHAALFVLQRTADAVDQCAFAGSVRADQPDSFAGLHLELDAIERDESAETFADVADVKKRAHLLLRARRRSCTRPTTPLGAMTTNPTSRSPTISRLTAEEMVTVAICCREPSRMAPTSGPTQLVVPPIMGMAMELTPYSRPNAEAGCR